MHILLIAVVILILVAIFLGAILDFITGAIMVFCVLAFFQRLYVKRSRVRWTDFKPWVLTFLACIIFRWFYHLFL